jgi:hypothetical protein
MNIDIALLTETKLNTDDRYTKQYFGYEVMNSAQGKVAIAYRSSKFWQVEAVKRCGPDVISFHLVTGLKRY